MHYDSVNVLHIHIDSHLLKVREGVNTNRHHFYQLQNHKCYYMQRILYNFENKQLERIKVTSLFKRFRLFIEGYSVN